MSTARLPQPTRRWATACFVLLQIGVMLVAISHESFWIDEFWNAYFVSLESLAQLLEALRAPYGSQTPLHFVYGYFWGQYFPHTEAGLRLSNLPLFLMGQASLLWGLRSYPRPFGYALLAVSALHPMVWQYANELRPYIMIYAGSEMILAYLLHIHAIEGNDKRVGLLASSIFVVGSILLFGASLLGAFWVAAACAYVAHFHYRHLDWRYLKERSTLLLVFIFLIINGLLTLYYLSSLLAGGGASRIASTSAASLLFAAYELLGLSGVGPSRLELRATGLAALSAYWVWLIPAMALILATLVAGILEAKKLLATRSLVLVCALGLLPIAIVVLSGFVMHWRVLGRHLMATLPLLNLLIALGVVALLARVGGRARPWRSAIAVGFLLTVVCSSLSLRFSDRHRKDDYLAAATLAKQGLATGKRVWWAADALGARYYGLPGEFDYMGELTNMHKPYACLEQAGVLPVSGASMECLERLRPPDVVILSKPETFDGNGAITAYLRAAHYVESQKLPAFTIWRPAERNEPPMSKTRALEKE